MNENARLTRENKDLRECFSIAQEAFIANDKIKLEWENNKQYIKILEQENKNLQKNLDLEKGKNQKLTSMLFHASSEKYELTDEQTTGKEGSNDENKIPDDDLVDSENENKEPEKTGDDTGNDLGDKSPTKKPGGQKGHPGSGRKIPKNLPVVEKHIYINEENNPLDISIGNLEEGKGMVETSYIVRKHTHWYVEKIIRHKYFFDPEDKSKIITAPIPPRIIPQGKFGDEVWIDILIDKYQQHIPIERQIFPAHQEDVDFHAGTIFNGLQYIYTHYLEMLQEVFVDEIRKSSRWHADETRWYMLNDLKKKLWYMWGFKSENTTLFVLDSTRSANVPAKTLFGINEVKDFGYTEIAEENLKILCVDRFSSYKCLENLGLVILAFCWAHVRRDFTDTLKKYPKNNILIKWANSWLTAIAGLYHLNNKRVSFLKGKDRDKFLDYDIKLKDAISKMKDDMLSEVKTGDTAKEKLKKDETLDLETEVKYKIMVSMNNHWDGLNIFVNNPEIPMDNNKMENGIRPIALGRNNYRGTCSDWGGELSAIMYSLIETCKQNKINPKAYFKYYFDACIKSEIHKDKVELQKYMPFNLSKEEKIKFKLELKKY